MTRNLLGYHDKVWNEIYKFTYTGNDQSFTLDAGTYLFVCNGAFGGYGIRKDSEGNHLKVNGGTTYGIIDLDNTTTFHAVVGGDGGDAISNTEPGAGGFNGGANGGLSYSSSYICGAGGGGASDIRLLPYDPNEYPTYDQYGNTIHSNAKKLEFHYKDDEVNIFDFNKLVQNPDVTKVGDNEYEVYDGYQFASKSSSNRYSLPINGQVGETWVVEYDYEELEYNGSTYKPAHRLVLKYDTSYEGDYNKSTLVITYEDGTTLQSFSSLEKDQWVHVKWISAPDKAVVECGAVYVWYGRTRFKNIKLYKVGSELNVSYTLLDYIYAWGYRKSGYFNTGYIPKSNTRAVMDCVCYENTSTSYEALFGARTSAEPNLAFMFDMRYKGQNTPSWTRHGNTVTFSDFKYNERIIIDCYEQTAQIKWHEDDEQPIASVTNSGTLETTTSTLIINGINTSGSSKENVVDTCASKFKLYEFKLSEIENDEEILKRDYVPAIRESDNVVGLFDKVNEEFITPSSTGYWEPGPPKCDTPSLHSRILVAGGGGGGLNIQENDINAEGGVGGGVVGGVFGGTSGDEPYFVINSTNTTGYAFGYGKSPSERISDRDTSRNGAGGGGGGWYGGHASSNKNANTSYYRSINGCGGSGYAYTSTSYIPDGYSPDQRYQFHDVKMTPMTSQQSSVIIYQLTKLKRDDVITFPMIGRTEYLSLPPGEYNMQVYGASGSISYNRSHFSKGGYSHGILTLMNAHDIYVNVGGCGLCNLTEYPVSFNGGGKPTSDSFTNKKYGGGASDIRIDYDSLYSRIIVAGGSGAEGGNGGYGGTGGGESGGVHTGSLTNGTNYGPGTQTSAGTSESAASYCGHFGQGGNQSSNGYAPGGGGWYGGSGNSGTSSGGGSGGSGYVLTEQSYKPDGYIANNEEFYLTNAETIQGGNSLPFGQVMIQIKVNSIMQDMLCRDSHGLKYFNTETNEWTTCPISLSKEAFDEYGSYTTTFDGLDDKFEVLFYDENQDLDKLVMNVVPPEQTILLHTHRRMDGSTLMIDEDEYDEGIFNSDIKVLREKTSRDVIIAIHVNKLQSGKQQYRLYSAQMFYNGDLGAYKYISPEEQYKMKQLHTESYYQYDKTTRPDMFDENGMMLKKQWLLPVGSGNNIPIEYRSDIVDGDVTTIHDVQYAEYQRSIYIGMLVTKGSSNNTANSYFIVKRLSMISGTLETIANVPYSAFSSDGYYKLGGILVDDKHVYFARNNDRCIYKIEIMDGEVATTCTSSNQLPSSRIMEAFGHIIWFDNEHTTIAAIRANYLMLYNIEDDHWDIQNISFNYSPQWIQSSKKTIVTSFGQYVAFIDKSTFQTKTFTLTMNSAAKYCYHDGTWYVVQKNYIYTIDESKIFNDETTSMDNTIVLSSITNNVADAHYAGGALFITQMDSRSLIVYDLKNKVHTGVYLRWSIPAFSNYYINPAFSFKGSYYLMRNSLMYIDYSGMTKYNMGYKYNRYIGYYNQSMIEDIECDERFVTVNNSCTIVTDGNIEYDFEHSGHVSSVSISKKDFNQINGISVKYKE